MSTLTQRAEGWKQPRHVSVLLADAGQWFLDLCIQWSQAEHSKREHLLETTSKGCQSSCQSLG